MQCLLTRIFAATRSDNLLVSGLPRLRVGMLAYTKVLEPETRNVPNALKRVAEALEQHPDLDVLLAPEWFLGSPGQLRAPSTLARTTKALAELTAGRDTLVLPGSMAWNDGHGAYRNSAIAASDGKVLLRYDKRADGGDSDLAAESGLRYEPGTASGVFNWNNLRVGVEICKDHSDQTLRRDLKAENAPPLDLQLVVSAGVWNKSDSAAIRPGGALLNDEGSFWGPQILERLPGERPTYVAREDSEGASIHPLSKDVELQIFDVGGE